jgi:hypothetical protein
MRLSVAIAVFILAAGRAAAQPAPSSPEPTAAQPTQPPGEVLSETTALWLGIGATAASWSLLAVGAETDHHGWAGIGAVGTFLAPGAGQLYAGSLDGRGVLLRLAGIGVNAVAAGLAGRCDERCGVPLVVASLGLGFYVWGTIHSIATAPGEVRRHNEQVKSLSIVPVIQPDRSGVMLVGEF